MVKKMFLKEDPDFAAVSERNKANRGNVGTHSAGACALPLFQKKLVYMGQTASISSRVPT